jgi:UDP-2-acetamido-2,6-beta-L-arabino-hexul-4-ose reductase
MKVAITGARGFIGRNLAVALQRDGVEVAALDVDDPAPAWAAAMNGAQFVFHLAGINRPEHEREFVEGNVGSLETLFQAIDASHASPVIVLTSSTQAIEDNPYGRSKALAERTLESWATHTGAPVVIYRLPGVFGKWCRPDYNSVVATFCHNIARDLPIQISDPSRILDLIYVDDVVGRLRTHLGEVSASGVTRGEAAPVFRMTLGDLADRIRAFRESRKTLLVSDTADPLTRRLLATYTSYIPPEDLSYRLEVRTDARGSLAELLKAPSFGQIFVSRTLPGITRGNHYHDLKVEKFCVLQGEAIIRFRSVLGGEVTEHRVSGAEYKVVDIPPGMAHNIENVGTGEMVVLFWACEIFDPERPDTYAAEVPRV